MTMLDPLADVLPYYPQMTRSAVMSSSSTFASSCTNGLNDVQFTECHYLLPDNTGHAAKALPARVDFMN